MSVKKSHTKLISLFGANLAIVGACALSPLASAAGNQESVVPHGFTLNPALGWMNFSSESNLESTLTKTLGLGYQFDNPYAVELGYTVADTDIENSNIAADIRHLQVDGLYHFNHGNRTTPYALLGLGQSDMSTSFGDGDDEFVNAGVGVKFLANKSLSVRSDLRAIRNLGADSIDTALKVGLTYVLGATSEAPKKRVLDDDGDGIANIDDLCPSTPANTVVDSMGCGKPIKKDDDNDGVENAKDKCPDTESGASVNSDGCYRLEKSEVTITLNVTFETNSDVVKTDAKNQMSDLAKFMKQYSQTQVLLEGYTDSRGAASYNQKLSELRAKAIAKQLETEFGIDASRISAVGRGEENPIADNSTAAGRQKNRRVEAVITTQIEKRVP